MCLTLMKDLLSRDSSSDPLLISQLGYIQLQIGDLEGAKASFLKADNEGKSNGSSLLSNEGMGVPASRIGWGRGKRWVAWIWGSGG